MLSNIVMKRDMSVFRAQYATNDVLLEKLRTNSVTGLADAEIPERRKRYGPNMIEPPPPTPFWRLMVDAVNDKTMITLIVAAVVSLVLTTTVIPPSELEYIDSIAILVAVVVVVLVTSTNNYSKEKQFRELNKQKDDKPVEVLRSGVIKKVSIHDVVVGDICHLLVGFQIACDGVCIKSDDIKVDESGMTGESREVSKTADTEPLMIGSCLITAGSGFFVATAVGRNSIYGKILESLQEEDEQTPLQEKLEKMAGLIGNVGMGAAAITFIALIIKFFFTPSINYKDPKEYVLWVNYFILAVTIIVVAVPEGLPLAVTISLAYSMKQMMKDYCLVRKLEACETMGSVTNICSDKTGTLTQNQMKVVRAFIGEKEFKQTIEDGKLGQNIKAEVSQKATQMYGVITGICSTAFIADKNEKKEGDDKKSAAFEDKNAPRFGVNGNKTEGALLYLLADIEGSGEKNLQYYTAYQKYRAALKVGTELEGAVKFRIDFSSNRKRMTYVVNSSEYLKNIKCDSLDPSKLLVLSKGAPAMMLPRCKYIQMADGTIQELDEQVMKLYKDNITEYAKSSLRPLILAFKEVPESTMMEPDALESNLVIIGMVGIQDPLRPAVIGAVADCRTAGIRVRMVTGDNIETAVAIAKDAGIIEDKNMTVEEAKKLKIAIEGVDIRDLEVE